MGDLIENLITLVLWIVASYYLRSKRGKAEQSSPAPQPTQETAQRPPRRVERDPLEESARRRPQYPTSLDDLDETELQLWEERLLQFAEDSGLFEDEDGWEVPWSGYRYYDLDELFDLYVHRRGKPLEPPADLVLVEGPNGEQMPVLVPREPEEELKPEPDTEVVSSASEEPIQPPTIVIVPPQRDVHYRSEDRTDKPVETVNDYRTRPNRPKAQARRDRSQALVAGLIMSELGVFRRR